MNAKRVLYTLSIRIKAMANLTIGGDGVDVSLSSMFRTDNIIKLQRLYSQKSRINWSELENNNVHILLFARSEGIMIKLFSLGRISL